MSGQLSSTLRRWCIALLVAGSVTTGLRGRLTASDIAAVAYIPNGNPGSLTPSVRRSGSTSSVVRQRPTKRLARDAPVLPSQTTGRCTATGRHRPTLAGTRLTNPRFGSGPVRLTDRLLEGCPVAERATIPTDDSTPIPTRTRAIAAHSSVFFAINGLAPTPGIRCSVYTPNRARRQVVLEGDRRVQLSSFSDRLSDPGGRKPEESEF